jgi:hypothetical protein
VTCPVPVPPATAPTRQFTTTTGAILHKVPTTKVPDFERFLDYVRDALAKTTNATLREQARGWKFLVDTAPGPNGDVVYVFLFDPAVPCVDYALGPVIAEAYPDPAQGNEVWNLYKLSVRDGGTLMNLAPVPEQPLQPILSPATTPVSGAKPAPTTPARTVPGAQAPPPQQTPRAPLDANPTRPPTQ